MHTSTTANGHVHTLTIPVPESTRQAARELLDVADAHLDDLRRIANGESVDAMAMATRAYDLLGLAVDLL